MRDEQLAWGSGLKEKYFGLVESRGHAKWLRSFLGGCPVQDSNWAGVAEIPKSGFSDVVLERFRAKLDKSKSKFELSVKSYL